ncbi:TraB/VirB10 family protein [Thioalkalivibrio thiocyanodenitrificans]|uniref:TraB/VirB10 family protein n=1 Tax=Thioalkalivibrio thiocyanodenitrificans TaxID=243063 RepID=UPI00037FDF5C|nr:TraB/VirB10 family protein [Thioalkalivibrio thiocyanodenitrificans]
MADEKKGNQKTQAAPDKGSDFDVDIKGPSQIAMSVKKRWMLVGAGVLMLSIMSSMLFAPKEYERTARQDRRDTVVDTTPRNLDQRSWQATSQAEMADIKRMLESISRENQELQRRIETQNQKLEEQSEELGSLREGQGISQEELARQLEELREREGTRPTPLPPPPPVRDEPEDQARAVVPPPPPPRGAERPGEPGSGAKPRPIHIRVKAPEDDSVEVETTYTRNPYAGYLPPGSHAQVVLLNGLDAGSSDYTRTNPEPVLMRVQTNATLPGEARYSVKSCMVLGSAYGDLSSERVYVRLSRLSCVDKDNHLVLSSEVKGYVVDSDGSLGIRGVVDHKDGALLGRSLVAGFFSGLGSAFGSTSNSLTGSLIGTGQSVSGGDIAQRAGFGGAETAMNNLAQHYVDNLKNIFPVISVPNGRKATVVITDGVSLEWNDYGSLYRKTTSPVN